MINIQISLYGFQARTLFRKASPTRSITLCIVLLLNGSEAVAFTNELVSKRRSEAVAAPSQQLLAKPFYITFTINDVLPVSVLNKSQIRQMSIHDL